MHLLTIALLLALPQESVTEADYREAVICAAVAAAADGWAGGSDSMGDRMRSDGFRTTGQRMNGYAFQFGDLGGLPEEQIQADIDAERSRADAAVVASQTIEAYDASRNAIYRAADDCAVTLSRFDAARR